MDSGCWQTVGYQSSMENRISWGNFRGYRSKPNAPPPDLLAVNMQPFLVSHWGWWIVYYRLYHITYFCLTVISVFTTEWYFQKINPKVFFIPEFRFMISLLCLGIITSGVFQHAGDLGPPLLKLCRSPGTICPQCAGQGNWTLEITIFNRCLMYANEGYQYPGGPGGSLNSKGIPVKEKLYNIIIIIHII